MPSAAMADEKATEVPNEADEAGDELESDMININGTAAMVCALIVAFCYAPDGATVDLGDDCDDVNIWRTCDASEKAIHVYKVASYVCTMASVVGCMAAVVIIFELSQVEKKVMPQVLKALGVLKWTPRVMMNVAVVAFFAMVFLQASLLLDIGYFVVAISLMLCLVIVHMVTMSIVKRRCLPFYSAVFK